MGTAQTPDNLSRLLFGATRREVLALLFGRPDEKFYLREILRAAGGGSGAVQRELRQLVQAGLITREARGHLVFFSANRSAPIFAELQSIIQKTAGTADVLRHSLAPLAARGDIELAFVYGSVASGKQTAASDVDLLIVGDAKLSDVLAPVRAAGVQLGREVNVSVHLPRELRGGSRVVRPFLRRVLAGPKLFVTGDERGLARLVR